MTPAMKPAMSSRALPVALGATVLALCYGTLLVPGRALVSRDVPFLHLPLRTSFKSLLAFGHLPAWDPLQHAGQPILSNPHYAAFYPGTWLCMALTPIAAIHVTVLLHAILAYAGAWTLLARWGAGRPARGFAAVGYSAGGWLLSLPGMLLMFCGMAWLPWALVLAERSLAAADPARRGQRLRGTLGLGAVLGLQALNGDPASVLITWAVVLLFAALPDAPRDHTAGRLRWRRLLSIGGAIALGLLLASVQALPTWARLRDSARGAGLSSEAATQWSTRPARLAELFLPRLFGDAARDEEDLYFGARLHDRNFPFLQSIYPGVLVALLGVAALCAPRRDSIPRRRALTACLVLGVALGLGRFDPLFPLFRGALPFLGSLRYPEKFLLLALCGLCFAGALELDRLLRADAAGGAQRRHFGILAAAFAAAAIAAGFACAAQPTLEAWIRRSVITPLPAGVAGAGARYLLAQWLASCGLLTAVALWLAALRRGYRRWVGRAAVAFLLLDLAYYGRGLNPTLPSAALSSPRELERQIAAGAQRDDRIFSDDLFQPADSAGGFRLGEPGTRQIVTRLDALAPSTAATQGFAYALHRDFDLMLTSWGRLALAQAYATHDRPDAFRALLAAWNVGTVVRARSPEEQIAEFRRTRTRPLPAAAEPVPDAQPRWRFAAAARFVAAPIDGPSALADRSSGAGTLAGSSEILVGVPTTDWPALDPSPRLLQVEERGDRVALRLRSAAPALLIGALTFDDGWSARTAGGGSLPTWPTALGQLAVLIPAGEDTVELRYRDPWVAVGAAVSLVAGLGILLAAARSRH